MDNGHTSPDLSSDKTPGESWVFDTENRPLSPNIITSGETTIENSQENAQENILETAPKAPQINPSEKPEQNPNKIGEIINLEEPPKETETALSFNLDKIHPKGYDISPETLTEIENTKRKLSADGDAKSFYDNILAMREKYNREDQSTKNWDEYVEKERAA